MMNVEEAKAAVNGIVRLDLSEKYTVFPFTDGTEMDEEQLKRAVSEYGSCDALLEALRRQHSLIGTHLRIKNEKMPALLKMVGYMLDVEEAAGSFFCGREEELMKMNIIIHKKIKNNVLLVGHPGVGKTKLVEEFARQNQLHNVFVVECAKLIGSTEYRGAFEQRTVEMINYAKSSGMILFFDEIHSLINLGRSMGGMSVTDILKPFILDEGLIFIGATTVKEVGFFVEDEAFKRRFSLIKVEEPSDDALAKIRQAFEQKVIGETLLSSAQAELAVQRLRTELPEQFFPDKLVDFLDYMYAYKIVMGKVPSMETLLGEYIADQKTEPS